MQIYLEYVIIQSKYIAQYGRIALFGHSAVKSVRIVSEEIRMQYFGYLQELLCVNNVFEKYFVYRTVIDIKFLGKPSVSFTLSAEFLFYNFADV